MSDQEETNPKPTAFDFTAFPADTVFYERREGVERRDRAATEPPVPPVETPTPGRERRAKKERRRRIDPTTFEKQYTDDELEFMNAMQRFKVQSGKSFPSAGEVLNVAYSLGYCRDEPAEVAVETNGQAEATIGIDSLFESLG